MRDEEEVRIEEVTNGEGGGGREAAEKDQLLETNE